MKPKTRQTQEKEERSKATKKLGEVKPVIAEEGEARNKSGL